MYSTLHAENILQWYDIWGIIKALMQKYNIELENVSELLNIWTLF